MNKLKVLFACAYERLGISITHIMNIMITCTKLCNKRKLDHSLYHNSALSVISLVVHVLIKGDQLARTNNMKQNNNETDE